MRSFFNEDSGKVEKSASPSERLQNQPNTNLKRGHLILINGGSSSGKTSTCRAFQDIADEHYVSLGIDLFWLAIPPKQLQIDAAEAQYYQTKTYYVEGKPY